eukprot:758588-Hanusia_phi.AAC.3
MVEVLVVIELMVETGQGDEGGRREDSDVLKCEVYDMTPENFQLVALKQRIQTNVRSMVVVTKRTRR